MTHDVARTFGVDYIYFDLIFITIYVAALIRARQWEPLVMGLFGGTAITIIDAVFWWQVLGTRELSVPFSPWVFMIWFSYTYGIAMFSWMFLMFQPDSNKLGWTALLFGGWLAVAFLSQWIPLHDTEIMTLRHMEGSRTVQIVMMIAGYVLLLALRYPPTRVLYLFGVGFFIHFMMEFSLWVSGIRPTGISLLVYNAMIESTMGIPILYLLYDRAFPVLRKRYSPATA